MSERSERPSSGAQHLRYEVEDGVGTITIDRAEKRNAMTYAMLGDFIAMVGEAGRDDRAQVVVVTGTGGSFCAGTDLADLTTITGTERGVRGAAEEAEVWWPLVQCPKPTIAAVDGPAVGMGAEFATQCDVRIATTRARFAWNFVHRGLVPDTGGGSWLLPRILGVPVALELLYSGRFLEAEEAEAKGFVHQVVAPDGLPAATRAMAETFLAGSPFAIGRLKELVYKGLERDVSAHMAAHVTALSACFKSEDHAEGVASFLERRPARFTGR